MTEGNAAKKLDTEYPHNVRIRAAGIKYPPLDDYKPLSTIDSYDPALQGRTVIDVYSQGGSILGMQQMIDALAKKDGLDVKTAFKFNGATGRIEVNLPTDSGLEVAKRLDALFRDEHPEYTITHSFESSFANAVEPIRITRDIASAVR